MPPAVASKACEPCRKKRRKCDLALPGCSQCRRAKVQCPGYRDAFESRVRDESESTARKFQTQKTRRSRATEEAGGALIITSAHANQSRLPLKWDAGRTYPDDLHNEANRIAGSSDSSLTTIHIPDDVNQTALAYFMHAYSVSSFFNYLPDLYSGIPSATRSDVELILSVPSLILLAQNQRDSRLRQIAYARHATALQKTQQALASPHLVTHDSTLLSVLLLGLFESLVLRTRKTDKWKAHMEGSAALLKLRGKKQFDTALGRRLFYHCITLIVAKSSGNRLPVPDFANDLREYAASIGYVASVGLASAEGLLSKFAHIRDSSAPKPPTAQHVQQYLDLEREIVDVLTTKEISEPYVRVETNDLTRPQIRSYGSRYDLYPSYVAARRWNGVRIVRLFVNENIEWLVRFVRPQEPIPDDVSFSSWPEARELAALSAESAINDMLYSVPYHIEFSTFPAMTARSLVLPLWCIANSVVTPISAQLYARERLEFLATEYGMVPPRESFHDVEHNDAMGLWLVATHWS